MLILGIDDAGRGPVIGPMILSGVLVDEKTEKELKKLGVRDSKQLSEKRREHLAGLIKEKAETFETVIISPNDIEKNNKKGINLNQLEAIACARIINKINKGYKKIKIIIDCPSTSLVNWKNYLESKLENKNVEISCEHKADRNHISVSAASILAKSTREKEMFKLKEKYGHDMGSGYTSDPATSKFLKTNVKKYNDSNLFRKTWTTWNKIANPTGQKNLSDF